MSVINKVKIQIPGSSDPILKDIGVKSENVVFTDNENLDQKLVDFTGATTTDAGTTGLVPAPATGDDGKYLKGDGTWATPPTGVTTLAELTDVNLTNKQDGQALVWDDTTNKWVNEAIIIPVDSALSDISENPVQNKVIKGALDGKVDTVSGKGLSTNDYTNADAAAVAALGTASAKNVAASGDAATTEVVMGNDSRLTDARNAADVYDWAKAATKPTYTATEVGAVSTTAVGAANGVAQLDADGHILSSELPGSVDEIIEGYLNTANGKFYEDSSYTIEISGETSKIYVSLDTNKTYRWSGSTFVEISASLALGETSATAYRGDYGKAAYDHSQDANAISSAVAEGLYKIAGTAEGHIGSMTAVAKADITALGIPAQDTTYTAATGSVGSASDWSAGSVTTMTVNGETLEITIGTASSLTITPTTVVTSVTTDI